MSSSRCRSAAAGQLSTRTHHHHATTTITIATTPDTHTDFWRSRGLPPPPCSLLRSSLSSSLNMAHGLHSNRLAPITSDPAHPSRAVAHGGPPVSQVDSPLRMMDNVLLAPHNSNSSPTAHENVQVPTAQLTSPCSCNSVSALQPPARCLLPPARCPACYSSSCSRFFLLLLPRLLPRILLFPPGPASSPAGS